MRWWIILVPNGEEKNQRQRRESMIYSGSEVVWEVEVEPDALAKLKGAYVGFLSEDRDFISIQRSFVMDGYHHIKITPLGFLKVLVSSKVEGEVKEVVGAVGWWSTLFERFEEWSPSWASNQRVMMKYQSKYINYRIRRDCSESNENN
jgi:hypothetical protein